ncbi:kinase phosphorylation protein-domain-containing protein [Cladochytrium replicatum]|nr:kinase phosphorylation protein-domain-containing protein [Cladochytrium replicatum]
MFGNHQIREGSRGGQGLFTWTDVKEDKHRENYLGHSLMAPVGRWQKNKDLLWYKKDSGVVPPTDPSALADIPKDEILLIKQQEADALANLLSGGSIAAKQRGLNTGKNQVTAAEIRNLVMRDLGGAGESGGAAPEQEELGLGKGLGFGRNQYVSQNADGKWDRARDPGSNAPTSSTSANPQSHNDTVAISSKDDSSNRKKEKKDKKEKKEKKVKKDKKDKKEKKDKKKRKLRSPSRESVDNGKGSHKRRRDVERETTAHRTDRSPDERDRRNRDRSRSRDRSGDRRETSDGYRSRRRVSDDRDDQRREWRNQSPPRNRS